MKKLFLISTFLFTTMLALGENHFVTSQNGDFKLNGENFKFIGTNNYYLHYKNNKAIEDVFKQAHNMGLKVIRMWAFGDGKVAIEKNNFSIQSKLGDYTTRNEEVDGLERIDFALKMAEKYDIKVILVFTNYWDDFGGMKAYQEWLNLEEKEDFYTNSKAKEAYKNYVNFIINRTNRYTGKQYKNDTNIFAWELANEPRNPKDISGKILVEWVKEMSSYIKSLDSNHMISIGDEGFFKGNNKGYKNEANWAYDGSVGVDWEALLQIPTIDFGTAHVYPEHWGVSKENIEAWGSKYIKDHAKLAEKYNKAFIVEEYGVGKKLELARDEIYEKWNRTAFENGTDGTLFWILTGVDSEDPSGIYQDYDGFRIMNDSSKETIMLKEIANKINKKH